MNYFLNPQVEKESYDMCFFSLVLVYFLTYTHEVGRGSLVLVVVDRLWPPRRHRSCARVLLLLPTLVSPLSPLSHQKAAV
jgi:hypothetical protein